MTLSLEAIFFFFFLCKFSQGMAKQLSFTTQIIRVKLHPQHQNFQLWSISRAAGDNRIGFQNIYRKKKTPKTLVSEATIFPHHCENEKPAVLLCNIPRTTLLLQCWQFRLWILCNTRCQYIWFYQMAVSVSLLSTQRVVLKYFKSTTLSLGEDHRRKKKPCHFCMLVIGTGS